MSGHWYRCFDWWYALSSDSYIEIDAYVSMSNEQWKTDCPCKCRFDTREEAQRHAEALLRDELLRLAGELCKEESK